MNATIRERGMLKTCVPERDMCVTTALAPLGCARPWTAVFAGHGPQTCTVWLRFWSGSVTPGGLAEAHERVVARVRTGELPAQAADDPAPTPLLRGALIAGGALAQDTEGSNR